MTFGCELRDPLTRHISLQRDAWIADSGVMAEERQEKKRLNLGQAAANASLVAIIAAWVIGGIYRGPGPTATLEQGKYYGEIVRICLYGLGALCALIALVSMRKYGRKGIILAAIVGLLWNSSYFILGGHKRLPALRAYARTVAEDAARGEVARVPPPRPIVHQTAPRAPQPAAPAKEVIDYGAINFLEIESAREGALKAVGNESGDDALVLQAWADTLGLVIAARQKASDAEKKLIAGDVLSPSGITSNNEFVRRRWLANDWARAVHDAEQALQVVPGRFTQQLYQRKVSPERVSIETDRLTKGIPAAATATARNILGAEQAVATSLITLSAHWKRNGALREIATPFNREPIRRTGRSEPKCC
jgi:hypothetical protein